MAYENKRRKVNPVEVINTSSSESDEPAEDKAKPTPAEIENVKEYLKKPVKKRRNDTEEYKVWDVSGNVWCEEGNSSESGESDEPEESEESNDSEEDNDTYKLKKEVRTQSKQVRTQSKKVRTQSDSLECWSMFVNFSQFHCKVKNLEDETENIFSEKWNPYEAILQNVAVYLSLLKNERGFSEEELGIHVRALGEFLPSLQLENKGLEVLLDLKDMNDEQLVVPSQLKSRMKFTKTFRYLTSGINIWKLFVESCLGKVNPFYAKEKEVKDFIVKLFKDKANDKIVRKNGHVVRNGLLLTGDFYLTNINNICNKLGRYLKLVHCGTDLLSSEPIKELLLAGEYLDGRIPSERPSSLAAKLAPYYDYTQYHAHAGKKEEFWQMDLVKTILHDVNNQALTKLEAAWQLGVTEDMISTALMVFKKDSEFNLTLKQYLEKRYGNEQQFWKEFSTVNVLDEVRDRILTAGNAAFMFGVSRSKLMEKVGRIKSEEEIKEARRAAFEEKRRAKDEKRASKPTQLQMQIKMAEDDFPNLSDYEKMRLKNLRERQAMLEMLNIEEDKKALRHLTPSRISMPIDYGTRDKSTRIKKTAETFVPQASNMQKRKSPNWVGAWHPLNSTNVPLTKEEFKGVSSVPQVVLDMKEVISTKTDYHRSVRFINSISEEVTELPAEAFTKNPLKKFTKIADSKVSSSDIRSFDTFGDLVCFGDSCGGVGVYLDGRSTTLMIHNQPVTRTLFVGESEGRGILSSALDGTVRLTDLTKQEVVVKYSWIQSGEKEQIGWIEPWERTNFLINSNRNSVKRIDIRTKTVDTLFSLTDEELPLELEHSWDEFSHDPKFGTNIGVHPTNTNLTSFCHQFSVKIFDLRNTSKPVDTIRVDQLHPAGEHSCKYTKGISGANWSPKTGKYFLACPAKKIKKLRRKQGISQAIHI
eukprot:GFUD01024712.1.p1 GENE.GFUD01024712.1~~GFUD01024712.1.p1  ORF type:complete len:926 (+),score=251.18 GFUD01024712.1:44-2821(+)